jgi:uncharacterized membrane protein
MDWSTLQTILLIIQKSISFLGVFVILTGVIIAVIHYLFYALTGKLANESHKINILRLNLGRILILGLEFIVAADLIGTTTTPDYYAVGLLAIIVAIRTLLSYSLNRELAAISKE